MIQDVFVAGGLSLLAVAVILALALRSLRLVAAVLATLLTGLVWSAGFAALAVGDRNVISVAAGVLFVGLGVDFGIHFAMRFGDLRVDGLAPAAAIEATVSGVGRSLALCTLTDFDRVFRIPSHGLSAASAELGLITGVGLWIVLFLTLTQLPALLLLFGGDAESRPLRLGEEPAELRRRPRPSDPRRRDARRARISRPRAAPPLQPPTSSGCAIRAPLPCRPSTICWRRPGRRRPGTPTRFARDLASADALKRELRGLSEVDRAITLSDYVPEAQEEKLEILAELDFLLGEPSEPGDRAGRQAVPSAEEQVAALETLRDVMAEASAREPDSGLAESMERLEERLDEFLTRLAAAGPAAAKRAALLAEFEDRMLASLPQQLGRLRRALRPGPIEVETLPERLAARLVSPDGRARVQTFPKENLIESDAFERFVRKVQAVDPAATGIAVNLVEFAGTTKAAFAQAMAAAFVAIAIVLLLLWRRPADVALAARPPGLGGAGDGGLHGGDRSRSQLLQRSRAPAPDGRGGRQRDPPGGAGPRGAGA